MLTLVGWSSRASPRHSACVKTLCGCGAVTSCATVWRPCRRPWRLALVAVKSEAALRVVVSLLEALSFRAVRYQLPTIQ